MVHTRSREISEKIASDLEKKADELEQLAQDGEPPADTERNDH